MKSCCILLFLLPFVGISNGSPSQIKTIPTKILSITQELHDLDHYKEQVILWKAEISKDELDSNAWMNYYLVCRIVNMLTADKNPYDLTEIHRQMSNKVIESYEYHYLTYLNGNGDISLIHHLEKAFAIDPNRTEVLSHFIKHYTMIGEDELLMKYNKLWLESGEISIGILNWNYNALIALEKDAILLTYGDNDTYPAWMLQQVHNVRPDVKVVNIHLLKDRTYLNRVFEECKIQKYSNQESDAHVWESDFIPVIDHIFEHSSRPIFINVTLPKKIRENYKDVLYTVGLAFKYSVNPFDNIATLKNNYENKFLIDYLRLGFSYDKSVSVLNSMNVNYLPAFISLYRHYVRSENKTRAEDIKEIIENIGEAGGRVKEVASVLEKPRSFDKIFKSHFGIKEVDKNMMLIKTGLYAADGETTNAFYEQFLMDLLKEKEFDLLETCKTSKVGWQSLLPEKFKNLDMDIATGHKDPDDPEAPVVNISYEAAELYCEWLTMVYNGYEKKKRHQKVIFRLPTEQEWEFAAKANRSAPYPWGGYEYKNKKGCFLANFYSSDEPPCKDCNTTAHNNDGSFFLVKSDSYFPNDFGLYNMSGNAAEMIDGGKIAKGGSWEDLPSECTIESKKSYTQPSPAIGFRVFMEVIR